MATTTTETLVRLRRDMVTLYKRRAKSKRPYVTSSDARVKFDSYGRSTAENLNFLGAVFRTKEWETVGYERSQTPGAKSRLIAQWKYLG